jgi:tetratricopeptide (TPR) repeat protein
MNTPMRKGWIKHGCRKFRIGMMALLILPFFSFANGMDRYDSLFALANKFYQDNAFDQAIAGYQQIMETGIQTPEVLYNLGNAYYKDMNLGHAILYYEKAKLLAPNDEDIIQNLAIANARIVDKIDVIPDFFIKRWIYHMINMLPSNTWAILSMVLFTVMLTMFLLYFFSGTRLLKRIGFYSAAALLLLSLLAFWCSFTRAENITGSTTAIVVEPSVAIKSSPDAEGNNVFVLHEGTRVMVIDSIENWKEIKLTDGNKGWVERKAIEPI